MTGADIKALRKRLGLRQEDFALLLGLDRRSLIQIEREKVTPRRTVVYLAEAIAGGFRPRLQ